MTKASATEPSLQQIKHAAQEILPTAKAEVEEIIKATEVAANAIMEAAEHISSACQKTPADTATIGKHVAKIFEHCTFQDITGQRATNVRAALVKMEALLGGDVAAIAKAMPAAKAKKSGAIDEASLMNGPQLKQPTQDDVDKLFDSL